MPGWATNLEAALGVLVWARALGVVVPANARLGALLYTLGRMVEAVGTVFQAKDAALSHSWSPHPHPSTQLHCCPVLRMHASRPQAVTYNLHLTANTPLPLHEGRPQG
jgi:hypothetical protein